MSYARQMKRERGDSSKLLVFMDILGFGAVTHRDKRRIRHESDGVRSFAGTAEMSNLANQFSGIVDRERT